MEEQDKKCLEEKPEEGKQKEKRYLRQFLVGEEIDDWEAGDDHDHCSNEEESETVSCGHTKMLVGLRTYEVTVSNYTVC